MERQLIDELVKDTTIDDIADRYKPVVAMIGIEGFVKLGEYAKGDELYFPKTETIIAPARNRRICKEYNGNNMKELAEKYGITVIQISKILKEVPPVGQMSIFDLKDE